MYSIHLMTIRGLVFRSFAGTPNHLLSCPKRDGFTFMAKGGDTSISEEERNDGLPLLGVIRKFTMIPLMSSHRPRDHRKQFRCEEQKRRGDRRQKRSPALKAWQGRRCKCEPEPFDPFAEVVRVRDVLVQETMGDRIVFTSLLLLRYLLWRLFRVFGLLLPANVEEDLVVDDVTDEPCRPHEHTEPEARSLVGSCEIRETLRRAKVRAKEGSIDDIEHDAGEDHDDV